LVLVASALLCAGLFSETAEVRESVRFTSSEVLLTWFGFSGILLWTVISDVASRLTFSSVSVVPPQETGGLSSDGVRRRDGYTAVELSR
jgi:hypothetical protein